MPRRVALVPVLLATATAGCFSFTATSSARPGETARATLEVARPMSDGSAQPIWVQGLVVSSTLGRPRVEAPAITIEERTLEEASQFRSMTHYDTVYISEADIQRLEVRRFSWLRSGLGALGLGAVVYVLYDKFGPSAEYR
jgi:hypothetical protein